MLRLLVAIVGLLAVLAVLFTVTPTTTAVSVLDVGQGDAILIQSGTGQVLVDGGKGRAVLAQLAEQMPWFDRRIEVLVVTHPQQDHLEGLLHVLDRYDVELVLLPDVAHTSQLQERWLHELEQRQIPYRFAWAGQTFAVAQAQFTVLAPLATASSRAAIAADVNNASVVMRLDLPGVSVLLTGDAERRIERMLVAQTDPALLDVDVLKVGHHGSNSSTHEALLEAASPSLAAISVGADNRFNHPHPAVLERLQGIAVWRTDLHGTITLRRVGDEWLLRAEQSQT